MKSEERKEEEQERRREEIRERGERTREEIREPEYQIEYLGLEDSEETKQLKNTSFDNLKEQAWKTVSEGMESLLTKGEVRYYDTNGEETDNIEEAAYAKKNHGFISIEEAKKLIDIHNTQDSYDVERRVEEMNTADLQTPMKLLFAKEVASAISDTIEPQDIKECLKTISSLLRVSVNETDINNNIKEWELDTNVISDGYHTFGELYEHRITLFIALCKEVDSFHTHYHKRFGDSIIHHTNSPVWKTNVHSDGSVWEGWFILGLFTEAGKQITYHLPNSKWADCNFKEVEKAPEWDGHTSEDVLERLKRI